MRAPLRRGEAQQKLLHLVCSGQLANRVFVKEWPVGYEGPDEPRWNCSNSLLPGLAKMTLSAFGSPEPYANLRKKISQLA